MLSWLFKRSAPKVVDDGGITWKDFDFPITIYAVALLYCKGEQHMLASHSFDVSGIEPLTKDGAISRARWEVAVKRRGSGDDGWEYRLGAVTTTLLRRE